MEILLFWVLCGLAGAFIAGTKNRSAAWSLLGFLFGPIGLLVICFVPKLDSGRVQYVINAAGEREAVIVSDTTTCPFCAETIKTAAKVCKHCGRNLTQSAQS